MYLELMGSWVTHGNVQGLLLDLFLEITLRKLKGPNRMPGIEPGHPALAVFKANA